MANEEHLARLRAGVDTWNAWRKEHPDIAPDLSGAHLRRVNLSGAIFWGADLSGANLSEANLGGANLSGANLPRADLREANLSGADLPRAYLHEANLGGAILWGADLSGANLREAGLSGAGLNGAGLNGANLSGAHLRKANLSEANLSEANLGGADLMGANLWGANLSGTDLPRAYLHEANLSGANLGGADLMGANLSGATLWGADLSLAILWGADLSGANLGGADLMGANLSGADLNGTDLTKADLHETIFVNVDLSKAKGLEACAHKGPSALDHRTLQQSGRLPLAFLRGCGLPDRLIDYLPSILGEAIQYYSCFISYSSKDEGFANRLHADLQNNGVRCWFAPHDLPIGAKTWDAIDEAIRLRDKVLLILSKQAIASDWVEDEVTKAFAEESRRKQTVLFPVRIDDTVMKTEEAWAVKLRDQRNIGDFRKWKDHDAYQQAFERVLRDLKTVPG